MSVRLSTEPHPMYGHDYPIRVYERPGATLIFEPEPSLVVRNDWSNGMEIPRGEQTAVWMGLMAAALDGDLSQALSFNAADGDHMRYSTRRTASGVLAARVRWGPNKRDLRRKADFFAADEMWQTLLADMAALAGIGTLDLLDQRDRVHALATGICGADAVSASPAAREASLADAIVRPRP